MIKSGLLWVRCALTRKYFIHIIPKTTSSTFLFSCGFGYANVLIMSCLLTLFSNPYMLRGAFDGGSWPKTTRINLKQSEGNFTLPLMVLQNMSSPLSFTSWFGCSVSVPNECVQETHDFATSWSWTPLWKPLVQFNDRGEPAVSYKWTGWSLRNNRLKFKTVGKLPIILAEFIEYTPI